MSNSKYIDISNFKILKKIETSFISKEIYQVEEKVTKKVYTAIVSTRNIDENTLIEMLPILNEVNFLFKANHPSIAKLIGLCPKDFISEPKPVIIIEFCKHNSLESFINEKTKLNENQILNIIFSIASGMKFLHSNQIIHRNLNAKNILLDENLNPKICGFDLAISKDSLENSMPIEGMPTYIAPEILKKGEYSEASDVYAFSMICYQILCGQILFHDLKMYEIYQKTITNQMPDLKSVNISESFKTLIELCWSEDPKKRPTFEHIINELKNDPGFITEKVNKEEYTKYIDSIEKSKNEFIADKILVKLPSKKFRISGDSSLNSLFKKDPLMIKYFVILESKREINKITTKYNYFHNIDLNFDINTIKKNAINHYLKLSKSNENDKNTKSILEDINKTIDDDFNILINKLKSGLIQKANNDVLKQILTVFDTALNSKKSKDDAIDIEEIQTQINKILDDNPAELSFNKNKLREISSSKTDIMEINKSLYSLAKIYSQEAKKIVQIEPNKPYLSTLFSPKGKDKYYLRSLSNIVKDDCFFITLYGNPVCTRNVVSHFAEEQLEQHKIDDAITIYGPVNIISFSKSVTNSIEKLKYFNADQTNIYFIEVSSNEQQSLMVDWCEFVSFISHITILCSDKELDTKIISNFKKNFITPFTNATLINCSPKSVVIDKNQIINSNINTLNDNELHNILFDLLCIKRLQLIPSETASSLCYNILNKKYKKQLHEKRSNFFKTIINDYSYHIHNDTKHLIYTLQIEVYDKMFEISKSEKYVDDFHLGYYENNVLQKVLQFFFSNMYPEFWNENEVKELTVVMKNEIKNNFESHFDKIKSLETIGKLIKLLKSENLTSSIKQIQALFVEVKKQNYSLQGYSIHKNPSKNEINDLSLKIVEIYEHKCYHLFFNQSGEKSIHLIIKEMQDFIKQNPITSDEEYGKFFSDLMIKQAHEKNPYMSKLFYYASDVRPISEEYNPKNINILIDTDSFNVAGINSQLKESNIMITKITTSKELYEIIENLYELHEIPFYLTRISHYQKDQPIVVEILNDDSIISNFSSYEFVVHYGLIVHSTKTMIESLIPAQTIEVANDFIIKTNSKTADYHVTIPANHHGWFNVPFEITNNSPTSNTDECLIYLKMIAEDITYLQEGNALVHQYRQGNEWITESEPVFLSYPNCDTAIIYINHCSEHQVAKYDAEVEALIPSNMKNTIYSRTWDHMNPDVSYNRGGRPYYVPVGYKSVGLKVDNFNENTCVAFHGTKATSVEPILRTGFKLPSQLNGVRENHIKLNVTCFGIRNFADAMFVSPSFKYSSLYGYKELIAQKREGTSVESGHIEHGLIRIILLQVRVKPNRFTVHPNTTVCIVNDHHYSNDVMEWRVPNPDDLFPYRLLYMHCTDEDYRLTTIRQIRSQRE